MSISTFHRRFRSATSMTPIQFRQQIRLQEARTLLGTRTTDVAEIGYLVGYESPSQSNREYRRTFGISPGRDAVTRRAAGHAELTGEGADHGVDRGSGKHQGGAVGRRDRGE